MYSNTLESAQHSQNKCPPKPGWAGTYFGNTLLPKGITQCKVPGRKLLFNFFRIIPRGYLLGIINMYIYKEKCLPDQALCFPKCSALCRGGILLHKVHSKYMKKFLPSVLGITNWLFLNPANLVIWYPISLKEYPVLLILQLHSNWGWNRAYRWGLKLGPKYRVTVLIALIIDSFQQLEWLLHSKSDPSTCCVSGNKPTDLATNPQLEFSWKNF